MHYHGETVKERLRSREPADLHNPRGSAAMPCTKIQAAVSVVASGAWVASVALAVAVTCGHGHLLAGFLLALTLAATTTGLALLPAVILGYVNRRRDLLDAKLAVQAAFHFGYAAAQREGAERRNGPAARMHAVR